MTLGLIKTGSMRTGEWGRKCRGGGGEDRKRMMGALVKKGGGGTTLNVEIR